MYDINNCGTKYLGSPKRVRQFHDLLAMEVGALDRTKLVPRRQRYGSIECSKSWAGVECAGFEDEWVFEYGGLRVLVYFEA